MAGIYIHIPFCKSRCIYCAFYSTVSLELRQRYVDAVCREWQIRQAELTEPLETIYIGGGTPSQLTGNQLRQLFTTLPPAISEVTIECNPDDVTADFAAILAQLPVNRVSMGVQTFSDQRLRFLHRRHTVRQVQTAVRLLREAGFDNISIDLMYGFPGETLSDWQHDIDEALAIGADHLSAYCLMVEEGTALYERLEKKDERLKMPDEEVERQMYETLIDRLAEAGYEHYELSNFARPGYRSQHNSNYWREVPYIGLGAAAHSYAPVRGTVPMSGVRQWNVSDIRQYIEAIERGEIPCEREILDEETRYNDSITVALRTSEGLDLATLSEKYRRYCMNEARRFLNDGLLRLNGSRLILTRQGLFVSDYVMASLIYV